MSTGCSNGAGVSAELWDLSLASGLILLVHSQGGVLCELPHGESGVLWGGQVWTGMCVATAIMSGQGLGPERLKGVTAGQNMCRKASLALWLVRTRLH